MVLLIINDVRREYIGNYKHLTHTFGSLEDAHLEGFLNVINDILDMFIKHVAMPLPH